MCLPKAGEDMVVVLEAPLDPSFPFWISLVWKRESLGCSGTIDEPRPPMFVCCCETYAPAAPKRR